MLSLTRLWGEPEETTLDLPEESAAGSRGADSEERHEPGCSGHDRGRVKPELQNPVRFLLLQDLLASVDIFWTGVTSWSEQT